MTVSGRQRWHQIRAYFRDTLLLLGQFRLSLLAFFALTLWGALWLWLFYRPKRLDFAEALYATLMLIFLNPTLEFPRSALVRPVFFVVPIVGVGIFTEAVIRFGILLFAKSYREEEWQRVMASTYRDHIVVIGIGRVGYRAVQEIVAVGRRDCRRHPRGR
jgi:voltage-gated potassium channel